MREFSEQEIVRREKLNNIKQPYPEKYEINYDICDACVLEDGVTGVKVAGRIVLMRKMGKMSFIHIADILGKIQIVAKKGVLGNECYEFLKKGFDSKNF